MRRAILALLTVVSLAGPAFADEGAPATRNATVLMSPLALPIVVPEICMGVAMLVNFVFVTLRLGLSADADPPKLRAMEPYFRDALVRAGYRSPFVRPDNYAVLDENRLKATVLSNAAALAGPGQVVSVQIVREQAQHTDGLPKPAVPARR